MSGMGFLVVGVGAVLGAWLRWALVVLLNVTNPALPYGTLATNLVDGYLISIAVGFFDTHAGLSPEWRLLIITGFLGRLTTFSTFSNEVVANILAGDHLMGALHIVVHLDGSLFLTMLGLWTVRTFSWSQDRSRELSCKWGVWFTYW